MPNLHIGNRPGQRPYRHSGASFSPRPRRPEDDEETPHDNYDPFGSLEAHGTHLDRYGNPTQVATPAKVIDTEPKTMPGQQPILGMRPINGHANDTDAAGGLHTGGLATGNLKGGPTRVGGTPTAQQNNVVIQSGARMSTAPASSRSVVPTNRDDASSSGGEAISDGQTQVAIPTKGQDGKQNGWEYASPAAANWNENFGHLPGTASNPTQPAPAARTSPPSIPVRIASGAGVEGQGLPHDVAVQIDQAHRAAGISDNFPRPPGGQPYGKISQSDTPTHFVAPGETAFVNGKPVAAGSSVTMTRAGAQVQPPTVPITHNANGTPVTPSPLAGQGTYGGALQSLVTGPTIKAPIAPVTSATPQNPNPAAPAPPIAQTPTLPTTNFPPVPTRQPATPQPLPAATVAAQTPAAPAFSLSTGAPTAAPDLKPLLPVPTVPASTVAGANITAAQIRTPQVAPLSESQAIERNNNLGSASTAASGLSSASTSARPLSETDAITRNNNLGQPKAATDGYHPLNSLTAAALPASPAAVEPPKVDDEELRRRLASR